MSATKIGKVAPFPPQPGQPYPPARNHPRWKELYRLHDEWMMKYWPFSSEKKRARIPFMNLAGFSTWCAPAADFDRMVWGARIAGIFFLADDYIDSGKMLDRIPGFKKAATGNGPLHPDDRAEICHDIVFRAIQATSHPRTFDQLTKCTHEWWDSNVHEPFRNLEQYLATRRVNIAMYFANAYFRYTLDINLTDEQVNHPLMREAEGVVSDHVGLTNDYFSYAKERLTNSDDTNVIRILQDHEGMTCEQAMDVVEKQIRKKEQDFITAGLAVLNDPELGKDPEVHRWIASLPYCMGGNNAWSQESGRYNLGKIEGVMPFPSLAFDKEETPADEVVDDTEESILRDKVFNVAEIPPPDFTLDVDPIEENGSKSQGVPEAPPSLVSSPNTRKAGILAFEISRIAPEQDAQSALYAAISSLIERYELDRQSIGRLEISSTDRIDVDHAALANLVGRSSLPVCVSSEDPASVFLRVVDWINSGSWNGRNVLIAAGDSTTSANRLGSLLMLVGPDAPLVVEPIRGSLTAVVNGDTSLDQYMSALDRSYAPFKAVSPANPLVADSKLPLADFDFLVFDRPEEILRLYHAPSSEPKADKVKKDFEERILSSLQLHQPLTTGHSLLCEGLASIVTLVPAYELFDKRIILFFPSESGTSFFTIRALGDTKYIRHRLISPTHKLLGNGNGHL